MQEETNDINIRRDQSVPPRYPKAEALAHGEPKKLKQFMLTDTSTNELEKLADELDTSRSEALERLIRGGAVALFLEKVALKKRSKPRSRPPKAK